MEVKETLLGDVIARLWGKLAEIGDDTKRLSRLFRMLVDIRQGMMDKPETIPENKRLACLNDSLDLTRLIIETNNKVQTIINPQIKLEGTEEQLKEAMATDTPLTRFLTVAKTWEQ